MYNLKETAFILIAVYLFLVGFACIQGDAIPEPRTILAETSVDTLKITESLPEYDYLYTDNCPLHGRCSRMHYRADTLIDSITIYTAGESITLRPGFVADPSSSTSYFNASINTLCGN